MDTQTDVYSCMQKFWRPVSKFLQVIKRKRDNNLDFVSTKKKSLKKVLTLLQSSISCCSSVMENGFDKYAHVPMSRVLSTNNAESQPLQELHPSISQNS